ncbi:MAG: HU family DNA-binding protein [Bacillota bacterium]
MNKTQLVAAVAAKAEMTKKAAEAAINAMVTVVGETLKADDKVQLIGFGTFEIRERQARVGRNPATGKAINIKASKSPAFKAGKALKDAVNAPVAVAKKAKKK